MAMMTMPTGPLTSLLTVSMSWAPTIELTDDQPMQARMLKTATGQQDQQVCRRFVGGSTRRLTQFHSVPSIPEARKDHLAPVIELSAMRIDRAKLESTLTTQTPVQKSKRSTPA